MRIPVKSLSASAAALVALVLSEGYTDHAVIPVKGDVPTIGFGTTADVKMGDTITPPKALERAYQDLNKAEGAIKQCITSPLYQYEYDVYLDFSYNVGTSAFCKSTMAKKLNAGDYEGACNEFSRWTYFQGKDCADPRYKRLCGGLVTRRQEQMKRCKGA